MQQSFKSTELAPDDRMAVERLVGRPLQSDEAVELVIHKLDDAQKAGVGTMRRLAAARIKELAKGKTLGGATIRELIDEGRRF